MTILHTFLSALAKKMHNNHIWRDPDQIYMARYFTQPTQEQSKWFLHNIRLADGDGHHSHPYTWQCSVILSGSYDEETLDINTGVITTRRRRFFNWIPGDKYHRITKLHGDVWTLFFFGPKHGNSWGFWVPGIGHVHNKELDKVKAELDRDYWTQQLAPTRYKGYSECGVYPSGGEDPVHFVHRPDYQPGDLGDAPGWYFFQETWADRCGPYGTRMECRAQLDKYCKEYL